MVAFLTILVILLSVASGALCAYWLVVLGHLLVTSRLIPTARDAIAIAQRRRDRNEAWPRVCVVIPAHNEEAVIGGLVQSLRAQDYPSLRVVLALDRCTDRTAEIVADLIRDDSRFEVVTVTGCPSDWAGKVNTVWQGVQRGLAANDAEFLIFADADTLFEPQCVSATVALALERRLDLLSLLSTLTTRNWFERYVQPAAAYQLMFQYPILKANREHRRRAFANGQFMLMRAEAYRKLGGHEAVKDELLEDLALARLVQRNDMRAGLFLADGVLRCRMYPHYAAFRKGWKRIYTEAANRRPARLRVQAWRARVVGSILPVVALVSVVVAALGPGWIDATGRTALALTAGPALIMWWLGLAKVYRMGHASLWLVASHPFGAWIVGSIQLEAANDLTRGKPTEWGGRAYARPQR